MDLRERLKRAVEDATVLGCPISVVVRRAPTPPAHVESTPRLMLAGVIRDVYPEIEDTLREHSLRIDLISPRPEGPHCLLVVPKDS